MKGYFWLSSYPKSGNTWLRLFLESYTHGGSLVDINNNFVRHAADRAFFDEFLDVESSNMTAAEIITMRPRLYEIEAAKASAPLFRKVHDAYLPTPAGEPLFPLHITLGAVHVVRDPRDVAISFAHHKSQSVDATIEDMAKQLVVGIPANHLSHQFPQTICSWSEHVKSWLVAPCHKLLVRYEDLADDPLNHFGKIVNFLGFQLDAEILQSAVSSVHFDNLKQAEDIHGFAENPSGINPFFRRGVAGGWRDSLTPEQTQRIEADHGYIMRQLGYLH